MALGSHSQSRSYPSSSEAIWQVLLHSTESLGWKIKNRHEGSQLTVKTGMLALCLLGIELHIAIKEASPGSTDVSITAKAVGQVVDYGLSKRETERLFRLLEERLPGIIPGTSLSFPSSSAPLQCLACGKELTPSAKFCPGCGGAAPVPKPPPIGLKCASCGAALREGKRFCAACGTSTPEPPPAQPAAAVCPGCSAILRPTTKFCTVCGTPAAANSAPLPPPKPVCSRCSQPIRLGAKFCPSCGNPLQNQ